MGSFGVLEIGVLVAEDSLSHRNELSCLDNGVSMSVQDQLHIKDVCLHNITVYVYNICMYVCIYVMYICMYVMYKCMYRD